MAAPMTAAPVSTVPHHGPVTRDCPLECLQTVLAHRAWNLLARAHDAPFEPPRTVGEVLDLCGRRQLRDIRGLGPRHASEIEAALIYAGLNLALHQAPPTSRKGGAG